MKQRYTSAVLDFAPETQDSLSKNTYISLGVWFLNPLGKHKEVWQSFGTWPFRNPLDESSNTPQKEEPEERRLGHGAGTEAPWLGALCV